VTASAAAPPFDPGIVSDVLKHLDKTIRARQLYPTTNPTYLRAFELLRAAFVALWSKTPALTLHVTETTLTWSGAVVLDEPDKSGQSLPWTLFKDGVREVTLLADFEKEELDWLLELIPKARRAQDFEDDMLTLLWEREFALLSYRYVEASRDPGVPLDLSATPGRWPKASHEGMGNALEAIAAFKATIGAGGAGTGAGMGAGSGGGGGGGGSRSGAGVGAENALERLISEETTREQTERVAVSLTGQEMAQLQVAIAEEYMLELRQDVIAVLGEIFELRADGARRREVVQAFDTMLQFLIAGRQFGAAASLLQETDRLRTGIPGLDPELKAALGALAARLQDPVAFAEMVVAMEEMESVESIGALGGLFEQLGASSLEAVLTALGTAKTDVVRALLELTADRLCADNPDELARLILSTEQATARAAAERAGAQKAAVAVPSLGRLLGAPDKALRAVAVHALIAIGSANALKALERSLTDHDKELRFTALRALAERPSPTLLPRVTQLISAQDMRQMEHRERRALFELYASVGGDRVVPTLDGLLNAKVGIFGRREDTDVRACAAMALGRIGSKAAIESLKKSSGDKDPVVKRSVEIAIDKRDA